MFSMVKPKCFSLPVCHSQHQDSQSVVVDFIGLNKTLYLGMAYSILSRALIFSRGTSPFSLRAFLAAFTSA